MPCITSQTIDRRQTDATLAAVALVRSAKNLVGLTPTHFQVVVGAFYYKETQLSLTNPQHASASDAVYLKASIM